jgi:hypothetical protein
MPVAKRYGAAIGKNGRENCHCDVMAKPVECTVKSMRRPQTHTRDRKTMFRANLSERSCAPGLFVRRHLGLARAAAAEAARAMTARWGE